LLPKGRRFDDTIQGDPVRALAMVLVVVEVDRSHKNDDFTMI
jgi:hypothetical protein